METKKIEQANNARRGFLAAVKGVGILGTVAVLIGKGKAVSDAPVATSAIDDPETSGYRETEHIRRYYDSVRY
jgi:hypothetical protein